MSTATTESDLAGRISSQMEEMGVRRVDLADHLGVHKSYITELLKGRIKMPSARRLVLIAEYLETTIEELLDVD